MGKLICVLINSDALVIIHNFGFSIENLDKQSVKTVERL